jgi:glycosyltransferase involved in cell wall biosynthesis
VIENDVSGFIDTDVNALIEKMKFLLREPQEARRLGEGARRTMVDRYHIDRFARDWEEAFAFVSR